MRRRTAGFTLIEAIIASGIALLVFGVGYTAISTTVTASNIASARIRDTENARLFFNMLERDLSTAVPGPTYMSKSALTLAQSGYTPLPQGNAIVLNEYDGRALSDIIQFYCRTDHPGAPTDPLEPLLFVRYGLCRVEGINAICRQTDTHTPGATSIQCPDQLTGVDSFTSIDMNPLALTNHATSESLALFDNVSRLVIVLQQWDPLNRKYIPPVTVNSADSILVTIIFGDEGNKTPHATTQVTRTYSKIFQLPTSFQ
ncbi:MAG: hypothetical protein WCT04_28160 [Planctomycetota bacterium]